MSAPTTPVTLAADTVRTALNRAADDVLEIADDDERIRDAVNLVVNAAGHYLNHPDDDLDAAIAASYETDADEVKSWLS